MKSMLAGANVRVIRAASRDTSWFWTIALCVPQYLHDHGYAAGREQATADFKNAWERDAD